MCIDFLTLTKDSLRFLQTHYISRKRIISKGDINKHSNSDEQPIPLVAGKRREYETISQCIRAEDYILGPK